LSGRRETRRKRKKKFHKGLRTKESSVGGKARPRFSAWPWGDKPEGTSSKKNNGGGEGDIHSKAMHFTVTRVSRNRPKLSAR